MKYPKGFPKDGITNLNGKEYITHTGLVWLVSERGVWSSSIDHVERVFGEDGMPIFVEVTVTVTQGDQSHTAIGDASIANVGRMISTALPRMAHTRSLNRALRATLGTGSTTAEEMPDEAPAQQTRVKQRPALVEQGIDRIEAAVDRLSPAEVASLITLEPECPACKSMVYDNRNDPDRKPRAPLWKCSNKGCTGGKGDFSWASWDEWPLAFGTAPAPTEADRAPMPEPSDFGIDEASIDEQDLPF